MSTETRPITPLPAGFTWGHVTGRIIHALGDTAADPDKTPEARGAAGTVTFTPLSRPARAHGVLVIHERVTVTLDADGYLVDAHGERQPVALLVGAYTVAFNLTGGQVTGFSIEVSEAHTVAAPLDLATVAPYTPPTGVTVTTLVVPASPSEGYALGWQDGKLAWLPGGGGGGVTDHGLLIGLGDDDHTQYALADGTRGSFAAPLGPDDNYVTAAEKAALHSHANKTALDNVSGVNTGDQDLSGLATTTALTAGLADKADATHSHTLADVTDYTPPDLSGYATTAALATVATSGAYADLTGTPTIPDSPDDIGAAPATQPINAQTGAYALAAADAGKLVTVTAATAVDVTVPSATFTAGQRVDVLDLGAERVTFVAGAGMTLNGTPTLVSRAQYSAHSVVFLSATEAVVVGDLGAA